MSETNSMTPQDYAAFLESLKVNNGGPEEMRLVYQTTFGGPDSDSPGNCHVACLATLLGCDLEELPQPKAGDDWMDYAARVRNALVSLGYEQIHMNGYSPEALAEFSRDFAGVPMIAAGKSPRGDVKHAVIVKNWELLHDPMPGGTGLDGLPESIYHLMPVAPWKNRRRLNFAESNAKPSDLAEQVKRAVRAGMDAVQESEQTLYGNTKPHKIVQEFRRLSEAK